MIRINVGGGTAAGVLCQAGLDVVVLEKGGYYTEKDFARFGELEGDKVGWGCLWVRFGLVWFGLALVVGLCGCRG
jgi:choline dehydrogenase-like flavoprotein